MKKIFETIKNIWRIEDLKTRILITLLFIAIYRFGSFIVLPGIDPGPEGLQGLRDQTSEGLMSLLNMFSGGAFSNASIFALGIMPYISASIVIQLLAVAVPYFQKMRRDGGSGRRKINQYTRWLTIAILVLLDPAYLLILHNMFGCAIRGEMGVQFMVSSTIILAAGSMFILWLGERITDKGIGNGVSLIIMIGIIARLPEALGQEFVSALSGSQGGGLVKFLFEIIALLMVMAFAIMLTKATRKVPVQYAKRVEGGKQYGGARQYIPLKLLSANVMPIIFAQAIMMVPMLLAQGSTGIMADFTRHTSVVYNVVLVILIIAFTYFYTAITLNPVQMAEDMKRNNGFIPGIKPGKATADYLDTVMTRILLPGSIAISVVAILPAFASVFGLSEGFAQFFGGTSLLILVGVVLDTLQQIESHMLVRRYDGLLNSGRVRSNSNISAY